MKQCVKRAINVYRFRNDRLSAIRLGVERYHRYLSKRHPDWPMSKIVDYIQHFIPASKADILECIDDRLEWERLRS